MSNPLVESEWSARRKWMICFKEVNHLFEEHDSSGWRWITWLKKKMKQLDKTLGFTDPLVVGVHQAFCKGDSTGALKLRLNILKCVWKYESKQEKWAERAGDKIELWWPLQTFRDSRTYGNPWFSTDLENGVDDSPMQNRSIGPFGSKRTTTFRWKMKPQSTHRP